MGIRIDGNNDLINAADGSLTVEGLSIDVTGIVTASGGYKVGSAYTVFSNGNVATAGIITATKANINGDLDVTGDIDVTGDLDISEDIRHTGNISTRLRFETDAIIARTSDAERLRIDSTGDINVGTAATIAANGNATFSGIVTATTYHGDGSNLSNITSTTINNNANNRVITGSGSANTLEAESNMTFTGSILTVTNGSGASELTLVTPSANDSGVYFNDGSNAGAVTYNHADDSMRFRVNSTEKMRIASDGKIGINIATSDNTSPVRNLDIADASGAILRLISSDDSLGANERLGAIEFFTDDDDGGHVGAAITAIADPSDSFGRRTALLFGTQTTEAANCVERLRITAAGYVGINESTPLFELVVAPTDANESQLQILAGGNGKESNVLFGAPDDGVVGSIKYDHNGDHMKFIVGTSEIFRANSNGICLGGTGSANGLSDYEEGTYTAHFNVEGQGNMTMSGRVGKYVKVGSIVTVIGGGVVGSISGQSSSNAIQFSNLPFPEGNSGVDQCGLPFPVKLTSMSNAGIGNMNGNEPYQFIGRLDNDSTGGRIEAIRNGSNQDPQNASLALDTNTQIFYMFTYITDA